MDGFVLQLIPDDEDLKVAYWTENGAAVEDLDQAQLYPDVSSARLEGGNLQTQYTGYTVVAKAASKGITLKQPHVAASPTNPANSTV
jgi:hypothetical protein